MEAGEHAVPGLGAEPRWLPGHDSRSRIQGSARLVTGDGRQFPCSESELLDPRQVVAVSIFSSASFRSTPHRYPPRSPFSRTTRWQGITNAAGFVAHARATARAAVGCPIRFAISA